MKKDLVLRAITVDTKYTSAWAEWKHADKKYPVSS